MYQQSENKYTREQRSHLAKRRNNEVFDKNQYGHFS